MLSAAYSLRPPLSSARCSRPSRDCANQYRPSGPTLSSKARPAAGNPHPPGQLYWWCARCCAAAVGARVTAAKAVRAAATSRRWSATTVGPYVPPAARTSTASADTTTRWSGPSCSQPQEAHLLYCVHRVDPSEVNPPPPSPFPYPPSPPTISHMHSHPATTQSWHIAARGGACLS